MTTFRVPAFKSSLCHWGLQLDDFIIKSDGNTAAHGDNHGFAVKEFRAFLVVGDDIPRQIFQPLRMPDNGFQFGPFGFGLLGFGIAVIRPFLYQILR